MENDSRESRSYFQLRKNSMPEKSAQIFKSDAMEKLEKIRCPSENLMQKIKKNRKIRWILVKKSLPIDKKL